jgi:alpha-L-rhamnosidase
MRSFSIPLAAVLLSSCTGIGMWVEGGDAPADSYVAFRGSFDVRSDAEVEIRTLGSSWFVTWIDGEHFTEGPHRFERGHPEYESKTLRLAAGTHVVAAQVHHIGVSTRILEDMPPFFLCEVRIDGQPVPVNWKCKRLTGYESRVRRINPQLGWIEWCDTADNPKGWRASGFEDREWARPASSGAHLSEPRRARIGHVRQIPHRLESVARGNLAASFGYEKDDVSARFFLRDLEAHDVPADGVWRRYDLGRVRLGRPSFVLDVPEGAVVEFAYCEALQHGRVSPYITLSLGPSCNLDHFVARGGRQRFEPLTPKGGRFLEIHVIAAPDKVKFVREGFLERAYYGDLVGAFACGDELLERIWRVGIATHRACAEDAVTDNPTRERGQWTGDVMSVGMAVAAVGFSDLRLCRRGIVQSAYCARDDGMVAGLCPGGTAHLSTYALQWVNSCLQYHALSGDRSLLEEMFPYAVRNIQAFEPHIGADGLRDVPGWKFVDWGYVEGEGANAVDIAFNLYAVAALRGMIRWCDLLNRRSAKSKYVELEARVAAAVAERIDATLESAGGAAAGWEALNYHATVLALRLGFVPQSTEASCVEALKKHVLDCFPNNPDAPRLSSPSANTRQLITPYFAHYAFPVLIERGEMDFVLDQYRKCWGWMLEGGRTTWTEVFDTRWTHCHAWCSGPTWQLSRYVLGLHSRFDLGGRHFELKLRPGSLSGSSGKLPLPAGGSIQVDWTRRDGMIHYRLRTPVPIWLHLPAIGDDSARVAHVTREFEAVLPGNL